MRSIFVCLNVFAASMIGTVAFRTLSEGSYRRRYGSSSRLFAKKSATKTKKNTKRAGEFWEARMDVWRPDVNDVERISWGKPAKKKGTGSRGVPHRLNLDERFLFDNARKKGFLETEGSGWRSQRREAPLLNTYRSLCDARGQASIVLHKGNTGMDELVCDLSPLRNPEIFDEVARKCLEIDEGGEVVFQGSGSDDSGDDEKGEEETEDLLMTLSIVDGTSSLDESDTGPWETRPIYQLPPYCISWELQRGEAKTLGKSLAKIFATIEGKKGSRKPIGVKSGKGRRHGGYGIG
mmetsp:Transcript_17332/g.40047  ORF Transcript_17332/g.40047 Transcript_17332/m.40047 type:complete len:293 (-) Transcript_17332:142-1020(-)